MKKSVLITGAAGFVGRYVAKEFANQGYDVVGMGWGKFPEYADWGLAAWYEADVSFEMLCEYAGRPDVIVHCAGGASVGASVAHPRQDFCLTVDASSHLLEFLRVHSPKTKLIYPSSAAVYGRAKEVPVPETAPFNPVSPYGVHKMMAEQLCQQYAHQYGMSIAIVRLFSVYGEELRKQLLWDACIKFSHGENVFFGTGDEIRDWLHVRDAARVLNMAVVHASSNCTTVNAGTGHGLNVKQVLNYLRDLMGLEKEIVFSEEKKEGDPDVLLGNVDIIRQWGFNAQINWKDGMAQYVQWYRQCR